MCLSKQVRIAVVGPPDSGKSTFISKAVKILTGRTVNPDALMKEVHYSDGKDIYGNDDTRTIKCAKIFCNYFRLEICFYDCPGHKEYIDQIKQGINAASLVIFISDYNRKEESERYFEFIKELLPKNKIFYKINSHYPVDNKNTSPNCYNFDTELGEDNFRSIIFDLIKEIRDNESIELIDVEAEAISLLKENIDSTKHNAIFFSGGKDSLVGLHLIKQAGLIDNFSVYVPWSGFDFPEVNHIINIYELLFKKKFFKFDNSLGLDYQRNTSYELMEAKALANEKLIKEKNIDLVSIQFRASDEGVRSKDHYIIQKENHTRFSPVFNFTEENIWRYIQKYTLPVCELYFKGYRSLGDSFVTEPCMPHFKTVEEIIKYIYEHPYTSERDGRKAQDNSVPFAMEHLRDKGFF